MTEYKPSDIELSIEIKEHPKYKAYCNWKEKYPNVMAMFRKQVTECLERKKPFGMWLLANKIRWDYWFKYDTVFKISNDYTSLITRELILERPVIRKYCRIKKMKKGEQNG